jgi:hypothetical protein
MNTSEEIQRSDMRTEEEMQRPEIIRPEEMKRPERMTPLLTAEKRKSALQFENRLAGSRPESQPATIQTQLNHSMLIHEYYLH